MQLPLYSSNTSLMVITEEFFLNIFLDRSVQNTSTPNKSQLTFSNRMNSEALLSFIEILLKIRDTKKAK